MNVILNESKVLKNAFKGIMLRSFFCSVKKICKDSKQLRLRKKALDRLENMLDIRSFFKVHTNLAILLELLLSKEQLILFKSQRQRALHYSKDGQDKSGTDSVHDYSSSNKKSTTSHKLPKLLKYLDKDPRKAYDDLK